MREKDAVDLLYDQNVCGNPMREARVARMRGAMRISQEIHRLRTEHGLTQRQLAEKAGTCASAIARAESADYTSHSLGLLHRIAAALGCEVQVTLHDPHRPVEGRTRAKRDAA